MQSEAFEKWWFKTTAGIEWTEGAERTAKAHSLIAWDAAMTHGQELNPKCGHLMVNLKIVGNDEYAQAVLNAGGIITSTTLICLTCEEAIAKAREDALVNAAAAVCFWCAAGIQRIDEKHFHPQFCREGHGSEDDWQWCKAKEIHRLRGGQK